MEQVIQVNNLSKKFGNFIALSNINFSILKGEIFGYMGPNGAGKTTTIRILLGLLAPTSGSVKILGYDPIIDDFIFRKKIAALLENPGVYDDLNVYDNLQFYAEIYRLENRTKKIEDILDFIGLQNRKNELAGRLSKGMKQKLAIARLLLYSPEVIFFDEPTSGLDPFFQREIRELIQKLAQKGTTIFLSSHNLQEVQEICTKLAFLKDGHLLKVDTLERIFSKFHNSKKEILFKSNEDKEKAIPLLMQLGLIKKHSQNLKIEILLNSPRNNKDAKSFITKADFIIDDVKDGLLDLEDIFYIFMRE